MRRERGRPNFVPGWPPFPRLPGQVPGAPASHISRRRGLDLPLQLALGARRESGERRAPRPRAEELRVPRDSPCPPPGARGAARGENFATGARRSGRERPRVPGPGGSPGLRPRRPPRPARTYPAGCSRHPLERRAPRRGADRPAPRRPRPARRLQAPGGAPARPPPRRKAPARPAPPAGGRAPRCPSRPPACRVPGGRCRGGAGGSDDGRGAHSLPGRRRIGAQPSAAPAARRPPARAGPGLSVRPTPGRPRPPHARNSAAGLSRGNDSHSRGSSSGSFRAGEGPPLAPPRPAPRPPGPAPPPAPRRRRDSPHALRERFVAPFWDARRIPNMVISGETAGQKDGQWRRVRKGLACTQVFESPK